jgi:hypothetical protein
MQELEPATATFLNTTILDHTSLANSMAFILASKLASGTLLDTQLISIISTAYADDPVTIPPPFPSNINTHILQAAVQDNQHLPSSTLPSQWCWS